MVMAMMIVVVVITIMVMIVRVWFEGRVGTLMMRVVLVHIP
jgi:hypothetical protein